MAVNGGKDGDVVHATPAVAVVNVEVGELGGTRELELLNYSIAHSKVPQCLGL